MVKRNFDFLGPQLARRKPQAGLGGRTDAFAGHGLGDRGALTYVTAPAPRGLRLQTNRFWMHGGDTRVNRFKRRSFRRKTHSICAPIGIRFRDHSVTGSIQLVASFSSGSKGFRGHSEPNRNWDSANLLAITLRFGRLIKDWELFKVVAESDCQD